MQDNFYIHMGLHGMTYIIVGAVLFVVGLVVTCSPYLQLAIGFEMSRIFPEGLLSVMSDYLAWFFWGAVLAMVLGLISIARGIVTLLRPKV